jgi:hypothetical protein
MSKKPLLSENQVAKWMKLANIDKNATQNFLTENKKSNKKLVKEGMGPAYARDDGQMADEEDMGEMDDMGMGDGSMDMEEPSVMEPEEEMDMGADEGEVEFDSVEDLQRVLINGLESEGGKEAIKNAVMDALSELGLADEMGGEEEELDLGMEGGDEGGDEPAEPAEDDQKPLAEGIEVLTDNEVINEVLKRVIRRLV